jgi:acetyl-CoA carboxylase alpha subunit
MASTPTLEFEKPIFELEKQIDELKKLAGDPQIHVDEEIAPLEKKLTALRRESITTSRPCSSCGGAAPAIHAHYIRSYGLHRARR